MTDVRRIRRQRTKGWRMPPNTVYVGRPTKWGNPLWVHRGSDKIDRQVAVEMYRDKLLAGDLPFTVDDVQRELAGKNLACWCLATQPCHADVLLKVANRMCEHEGCMEPDTVDCLLWNEEQGNFVVSELLCVEHCQEHGYCWWCGMFHAGISRFEFAVNGLCSECHRVLSAEMDEHPPDEELAMWEEYSGELITGWNEDDEL